MSVIEKLEQKLDRVIKSATEHALFSAKLAEDLDAIESKLGARIEAALKSIAAEAEARVTALKAELLGDFTGLSGETTDLFERTVGTLGRDAVPTASQGPADADRRIDPNTGLPVEG